VAVTGGAPGRSEPGRRLDPRTLPSVEPDGLLPDQLRAVPRGREFGAAAYAALKARVVSGQVPLPEADFLDLAGAEPSEAQAPAAPILAGSYDAIPYTGWIPPDPQIAVGPSDLIVAVNSNFRIYNKSLPGSQLFSTTLLSWFANVLPSPTTGISVFDPWTIYDQVDGRFVLLALAKRDSDSLSRFLISVSDNNTAQGTWCNWSLDAKLNGSTTTGNWADYAKVGTTDNSLIISANMFSPFVNGTFQYAKLRFLEKADLYNTSCPGVNWWDFWNLTNPDGSKAFAIQPALSYFASNVSYFVNHRTSGSGSGMTKWRTDTTTCCASAPSLTKTAISTSSYSAPPDAEQRGSTTRIDTGDARLLGAVYRSSGVWTASSTGCTLSGVTRSCLRWYQLNPSTNALTQQSTFGLTGGYYFFPAIHADASGNVAVVFSRSASTEFASIRFTGRLSTDPLNTLQASAQLRAGQGCYVRLDTIGRNRWGDYNGIAIDPSASKTWWIYSEYPFGTSTTCSNNTWRTTVGKVFFN
jgi:hypothetical protein